MVHGGFFYRVEKRRFAAGQYAAGSCTGLSGKPPATAWITGFVLLWIVYYASDRTLLIDPAVHPFTQTQATITGLCFLAGG